MELETTSAAIDGFCESEAENQWPSGRVNRVIVFRRMGSQTARANSYQTASPPGFPTPPIFNNLSFVSFRNFDSAGAVDQATQALDVSPNLRAALYNRALARLVALARKPRSVARH